MHTFETRPRVLSGDRPTGPLHLGHYVGSLKHRVELQADHEVFLLIADYHALTRKIDKQHVAVVAQNVHELVLDYLSVGIDPQKVTIYRQSDVPSVTELALLFGMIVTVPQLERVPSLKELIRDENIAQPSYGLLGYPVLQAADILHVKAQLVPVGKDQESHLELTREIVRRFNGLFGDVFSEPKSLVEQSITLPGIDGLKKMSKSLGNDIKLSDPPEAVRAKVMRMYTDPSRIHPTDPGKVAGNPVFLYHDAFNDNVAEVVELKERYQKGTVGDVEVKEKLVAALERFLTPIRERRAEYARQPELLTDILARGARVVQPISEKTLAEVKQTMGITSLH